MSARPSRRSFPPFAPLAAFLSLAISTFACSSPSTAAPDAGTDAAADASGAGPIAVEMNDVSILFPLPSTETDLANMVSPEASGNRGVLVPVSLYYDIGPITGTTLDPGNGNPETADYNALRLVSMRIDPCFASLAPDPHGIGCDAQLRLVFQEVTWTPNGASAFDSALHAFYSLTHGEVLLLAQAVAALRIANTNGETLGPLAPHPILVSQGLSGAMSQGLQQLILQYAGANNLVRLAQLSSQTEGITFGGSAWTMSAFDVAGGGSGTTPRMIPTLTSDAGLVASETVTAALGDPLPDPDAGPSFLGVQFNPPSTSSDSLVLIDDGAPNALSPSDLQAGLDAIARVENPADDSPNTIDCGSCHFATPTEQGLAMPVFSFSDTTGPLAFAPDGKFVTSADMALTVQEGAFNIHAFSYFDQAPGINQRVVNETAAVVEYLNRSPQ